jgi:sterol desaturase/sphingolipid hydroxylase (fatty acid hydroxylase superfamily)
MSWPHFVPPDAAAAAGHGFGRIVEFFIGPVSGVHTRYYWVFLLQAAVLVALVHFWQGGRARDLPARLLPDKRFLSGSSLVDWQLNLANAVISPSVKLFWRASIPALVAVDLMHAGERAFGPAPHALQFTLPWMLALTVLVTVADDLGYYVFHRAAHSLPWLWAFHKVHHSAEMLTPLVAGREHPFEMVLSEPTRAIFAAMALAPAMYCFGGKVNIAEIGGINAMAFVFGALGNQLLHSEVAISFGDRLNRLVISPAAHQIHHSVAPHHHNRNLGGQLAIWDWMFGTLYLPREGEKITFGLEAGAKQEHPHLLAAYLRPFAEIAASLKRPLSRANAPELGGKLRPERTS